MTITVTFYLKTPWQPKHFMQYDSVKIEMVVYVSKHLYISIENNFYTLQHYVRYKLRGQNEAKTSKQTPATATFN